MNAKLLLGLFAGCGAALALTGCSSDAPESGNDANGQTCYLRVAITDVNAGTRVENNNTNFEDGTDAENKIEALQFKFYDAAGVAIKAQSVTDYNFKDATTDQGSPSVGKIKQAIVEVTLGQGENLPSYVICSANPISWDDVEVSGKMSDLRNLERQAYKDGSNNFTMNNSVYFGTDPVSGDNDVKISGTPITKGQLFTTRAEAEAATGGSVVDIYIERMAAKVNFKIEKAADAQTVDGYTLEFAPEAWTVTADAPSMYSIKRFAIQDGANAPIPTLADVNKYLETGWQNIWNDARLFRSYWACSPAFYATEFPRVSDNISDVAAEAQGTGAGQVVAPFELKYYSYNQVVGDNGSAIAANDTAVTRYALENTMGKDAFHSLNPNAAAPSALLVGKYTVKNGGTALPANTSFDIWKDQLYFVGTVPTGAQTGAQTIADAMLAAQQIIATDANGTLLRIASPSLAVKHPTKDVRGNQALAENLVTLQLTDIPTNMYYSPMGTDTWKLIESADEVTYVNQQLAGQLNYAKAFTNGIAYFGIPIKHLRATEDTTNSPFTVTDGKETIDWSKVRIGDFGLVRNHVYTINVQSIGGMGSGVFDPNAPIVTPMDTYTYYIKYSIRILNWRIVPAQNVIL